MIVSLIKIGSISIKNKLGMMPSKQNIFAGLPLLQYQRVVLMLSSCVFVRNVHDAGSPDLERRLSLSVVRLVSF